MCDVKGLCNTQKTYHVAGKYGSALIWWIGKFKYLVDFKLADAADEPILPACKHE